MKITIGALAHVDAGKTSLSEAILYLTNTIRKKGRVDDKDAFLDYNDLEKQKGITIYNKQARFSILDKDYIYLDTPGHTDLAFESNRAISIIDCAIVIISSIEDIPTDTIKLFNRLTNYHIPILIFVNKMDISNFSKEDILLNIKNKLNDNCILYNELYEHLSLDSEELLEEYLNTNSINHNYVLNSLKENNVIPCFFGSALKLEGIQELLDFIYEHIDTNYDETKELNTYLYKIEKDLSYLKVLSGSFENKYSFGPYKINEIYEISGRNLSAISSAKAGDIVAVKGLRDISIGTYLPSLNSDSIYEVPSLRYRIISDLDANELYKKLETIKYEFPELKLTLENSEIYINLNGQLHEVIISNLIKERFNIDISFSNPIIRYKETITKEEYGVGHFEPLRHYAEVIVKIAPNENGIKIKSLISNQYANTLLSYLRSHSLKGILTNSLLTNIEITIIDIKTHPKHTEGQDVIDACKRAIRHGLSKTNCKLLEPYYLTSINTNENNINTIISTLTNNSCTYSISENTIIASISQVNFNELIISLKSRLQGNLDYAIEDLIYDDCKNENEVIENRHYDYLRDFKNPAGSIFCKSGAGHYVEPNEVEENMHLNMSDYINKQSNISISHNTSKISEEELLRVWNSLYKPKPIIRNNKKIEEYKEYKPSYNKPIIYLIDGYNLMYRLDEELSINNLYNARSKVIDTVCDFAGYVNAQTVLIFDAYQANGSKLEILQHDNITIVYTKQNQTADTYIENKSKELMKDYKVIVVTSDNLEQLRVFANDASIITSDEFLIRYENFKKNNKYSNTKFSNKPLEELRLLLNED